MKNRIEEFRKAKGLRQRDLSALADVDTAHLSRIENEHVDPTLSTAKKIADALEVAVDEVFDFQAPTPEPAPKEGAIAS